MPFYVYSIASNSPVSSVTIYKDEEIWHNYLMYKKCYVQALKHELEKCALSFSEEVLHGGLIIEYQAKLPENIEPPIFIKEG